MSEANSLILERMLSKDFYLSPYKFALWAYPWGEGDLKQFRGPRKWQREVMEEIEQYLIEGIGMQKTLGVLPDFFRYAIASGRGPGKSALVGMLAHWFISTRIGGSVWVAANGAPQLQTKTFPEIAKWVARGINAEFFDVNAMSIQPKKWFKEFIESPEGLQKSTRYYYTSGQLWSEENPDAFAGAHNFDGEMAIFDEASGIPDPIWTVQEGVFTENIVDRFWFAFSNPRKPDGAFFECFNKKRDYWRTRSIDSRSVEGISHSSFENIIKQFGEDSDEARVEVYGQFPHTGARQFMQFGHISDAVERPVEPDPGAPLLMGVDVARFGEDRSVIAFRRGRDARTIPWRVFRKLDTQQLAREVADAAAEYNPAAIFVDGGGVGGGVVDALKAMRFKVIEVQAGSSPDDKDKYINKRVELWARLKEWMETGCLPDNKDLVADLRAPQYDWHQINGKLTLETKEDMRKRGLSSPDMAEALIQTFARPVARSDILTARRGGRRVPVAQDIDYPMFG
jgi:hypothetical protein